MSVFTSTPSAPLRLTPNWKEPAITETPSEPTGVAEMFTATPPMVPLNGAFGSNGNPGRSTGCLTGDVSGGPKAGRVGRGVTVGAGTTSVEATEEPEDDPPGESPLGPAETDTVNVVVTTEKLDRFAGVKVTVMTAVPGAPYVNALPETDATEESLELHVVVPATGLFD